MISRDGKNSNKVIITAYASVDDFDAAASKLLTQQRQPLHLLRQ